jgi:hypothetical protein
MQLITVGELEARADLLDDLVERDAAIDPFCSRSAWQLSFHEAFEPDRRLWWGQAGSSAVLFAEREHVGVGEVLEPLENLWGFASPLVGPDAPHMLADWLLGRPRFVVLMGFPQLQARWLPITRTLAGRYGAGPPEPMARRVASLAGGLDGWLSRRSRVFRKRLRGGAKLIEQAGVKFRRIEAIEAADVDALYAQVLEIEGRTWKSAKGNGADSGSMRAFYEHMWPRLVARGQLRLVFAELDGQRIGYLHGALTGDHFRGLQVSFDEEARALGLGNALQLEMIKWLCDVGAATYDLGSYSAYKDRWAEAGLTTVRRMLRPAR